MFENTRSVPYTDENVQKAVDLAAKLDASYSGTDIYSPLKHIFDMGQPEDCIETQIFLLTAGDVHNFQEVVDMIASNSNSNHRLHTFGIGKSVNE